jgi:hypothetical protein
MHVICLAKVNKKHLAAKTETSGHGRSEMRVAVVVEAKELAEYHECWPHGAQPFRGDADN